MKHYKATRNFSFDGKNYVEGQEVAFSDEDILAKLQQRGQIASGKGVSADDVEAEARKESARKSAEADKQREKEAEDREKEYIAQAGKPKQSTRMKVDDQTQGIKEKNEKAGPNEPKK